MTASQADTLEDALRTFAPAVRPAIRPSAARGRYFAFFTDSQRPAAVAALESYATDIHPGDRTARCLVNRIQKGGLS
ncbi:hypothetical protein [Armatimonas rosea]|uniref:Uncharacterized protein n=1 Tax=Armatimonas rosea TaxID=685828 RepID=A0A7W9WAB5_ARMRO|nr:hypothetical protein [Armatimonas rosea]MBB6054120.1 hypothetical protein [Armatimonas rosea]